MILTAAFFGQESMTSHDNSITSMIITQLKYLHLLFLDPVKSMYDALPSGKGGGLGLLMIDMCFEYPNSILPFGSGVLWRRRNADVAACGWSISTMAVPCLFIRSLTCNVSRTKRCIPPIQ